MAAKSLTVMTFNVRYATAADGLDAWPFRKEAVGKTVRDSGADVIGFQEVLKTQLADLQEELPDFDYVGVGRDDGKQAGEYAPIFYRRDRFDVKLQQTVWLSETPEKPSRGWDAAHERIATLVQLHDKLADDTLQIANTHFDHRGEQARLQSAKLLREKLTTDLPVVLMGDFNFRPGSPPYQWLTDDCGGFADTRTLAEEPLGPDSTWNGFAKIMPGARIDFVFYRGPWRTARFQIVDARRGGRFVSDHLPVVVEFVQEVNGSGP
ncbi:MAG: endonuclease/exonuclease/phosphatase family protein [Pirellulales bacterium]